MTILGSGSDSDSQSTLGSDREAVTALILRERQSRDRQWWDQMAECFTKHAVIDMSWFNGPAAEFVQRSRVMDVGGSRGVHRLSPPAVHVTGDRAIAELPLVIEFRTDINGVEADLSSYARSQYRAIRQPGGWALTRITSIYERDTLTAAIPGQSLNVDTSVFDGLRPSGSGH